jgi:hypothetical protein
MRAIAGTSTGGTSPRSIRSAKKKNEHRCEEVTHRPDEHPRPIGYGSGERDPEQKPSDRGGHVHALRQPRDEEQHAHRAQHQHFVGLVPDRPADELAVTEGEEEDQGTTASATTAEAIAVDMPDPISTTPMRGR